MLSSGTWLPVVQWFLVQFAKTPALSAIPAGSGFRSLSIQLTTLMCSRKEKKMKVEESSSMLLE